MAKGYYEQLYHDLFKGNNRITKSIPKTEEQKVQKQIDNAKVKITKAGIDAGEVTDNRNPVEKLLNLTPNQNFLFDIFELLNRPQQALFGGIENAQKGQDFWEGAGKGFTGKKETQFKEILKNAEIGGEDREGKIDLVDILGFVGDVLLDPADLTLIPVTGGASIAAGAVDTAGDVAKGAKIADGVSDAARSGFKLKSLSSLAFDGMGKAIKGGAKITDTGIEKVLKYMDSKGVKNSADELVKISYKNPLTKNASQLGKVVDNIADVTKEIPYGRLETYKELKNWFTRAFNNAANMPKKAIDSLRKGNADQVRAAIELKNLRKALDDDLFDTAKKIATQMGDESAENISKIAKKLDGELLHLKEYLDSGNRIGKAADLIKMADDGVLKATDDVISVLEDLASDINFADRGLKLTVEVDDLGKVKLSKDWSKVGKRAYEGIAFDPEKLNKAVKLPTNYRPEQIEQLENIAKKYATDPIYKELYEKVDPIFNKANEILDKNFGTGLATKYADNAGYVRHAYDKDTFNNYVKMGLINSDGSFKMKGNTKVLGDRKYKMSVMEANNMFEDLVAKNINQLDDVAKKYVSEHKTLFKDLYTASFDDYLMNVPKVAKDSKLIDEILVKQTFGDWKELKQVDKNIKKLEKQLATEGASKVDITNALDELYAKRTQMLENVNMKILTKKDPVVPSGFKVLDEKETKNLVDKINKIGDELGIDSFKEVAKTIKGNQGKLAINNEIIRLIGINNKEEAKAIWRIYDTALNFFKRNKVMSPTFQMNNIIGNTSNMALGGISPTKQAQLFPKAYAIMHDAPKLLEKASQGIELTAKEADKLSIWNKFIDAGFGNANMSMDLRDMPDSLKKYFTGEKQFKSVKEFLVDGLPYLNNYMNNQIDNMSRLVVFMEGLNNPKFLQNLNVKDAAEAVRKILFDPSDLTDFERTWMRRIIPFYTFTKKNLAYHIQNLGQNGEKYHRLVKGIEGLGNMATDGNYENLADYLRDNLYIPIPGLGENGEYKMLRATLPFGQLLDLTSNPLNSLVSMTTPALRLPVEYATNKQTFSGQEIEKFAGEYSKNIPGLTKKQEYLLSQLTGLDVPLKQVSRFAEGISGENGNILEGLVKTITMDQNINTDRLYKLYDELEKLETIMKQYKQKGVQFSTMNELNKANKNVQVSKLMAKLNKLNGIKNNPYQ